MLPVDTAQIDRKVQVQRHRIDPAVAKLIRIAAGLSQDDIARALDVARSTVCRWESGRRRPSAEQAEKYYALLTHVQDIAA